MPLTIRRNLALREYDVKELPSGMPSVFSIKFVKKNGERVFVPRGLAVGLPFHVSNARMRGVMPVDNALTHFAAKQMRILVCQ